MAVLVRSIKDITQFEILLQHCVRINNNGQEREWFTQPVIKREQDVDTEPTQYQHKEKWQKGKLTHKMQNMNKPQRNLEVIDAEPSTSSSVTKNGLVMTRTQ